MTTHSEAQSGAPPAGPPGPGTDLLTSLLDGMDAGFFAVDADVRLTHLNREAERLLGWHRDDVVGSTVLDGWLVRPADAQTVHARLLTVARAAADASGTARTRRVHEFPLLTRGGGRLLVRAQVTTVWDAEGRPSGAACTFQEVGVQLDLERRVALSEALFAGVSWPLVLVDADLRAVAVNEPAGRALAVRPEERHGQPLAAFLGNGLEEVASALEHALAGSGPTDPVELWVTLRADGDGVDGRDGPPSGGARRCLLSGFLPLGSPLAADAAPLGVAWLFQDVTPARKRAQEAARRRFRDSQLNRAARVAAECADPMEAAAVHLDFALAGFAEHALLDVVSAAPDGADGPRLARAVAAPGPAGRAVATVGTPPRYRPGHPALEALARGVPVRATVAGPPGVVAGPDWTAAPEWPREAAHALCVALRSRGRERGVVTFLRGAERPGFDRADAAYAEDVALRVAAAVDLAGA